MADDTFEVLPPKTKKRQIIQIIPSANSDCPVVLCDDGSVWRREIYSDDNGTIRFRWVSLNAEQLEND